VLLTSSELEEVLGISHRTLLMANGRVIGEVAHGELDADETLARIFVGIERRNRWAQAGMASSCRRSPQSSSAGRACMATKGPCGDRSPA
jgi:hypothetical protein